MPILQESHHIGGNHRGLVVDNVDPLKQGRIKVQVHGFFDDVDAEFLPWAVPAFPLMGGALAGAGWFGVPAIGGHVWCFFEAGDYNQPVYFAEAPDGLAGHPTAADTNYPNRRGFVTPSGIRVYVDDVADKVVIQNIGGAVITITGGTITVTGTSVTVTASSIKLDGSVDASGATGSFKSADSPAKTVTTVKGIVKTII